MLNILHHQSRGHALGALCTVVSTAKQVTETPKFALLANAYTRALAEFQQLTKSRIVAVAELELKVTKCAIIRLIVDVTVFLGKASVFSDCRLRSQEQQQIYLFSTTALSVNPFQ